MHTHTHTPRLSSTASATNLGKLQGNPQPRNAPRRSLRLATLDCPLGEFALARLVDLAAQLAEILQDNGALEAEIVAEIGRVGSELVGRVAAASFRQRRNVQGQSADGSVEERDVVFSQVGALRREFAPDRINDGVGDQRRR